MSKSKRKNELVIGLYGITFFTLLFLYLSHYIPAKYEYLYQTVFTFLEYLLFTLMIWLNITTKILRGIMLVLSILFIAFQLFYFLGDIPDRLDSIPVGIETILIFIYITFFFYENFRAQVTDYIYNHPGFWVSIGMLIYLGSTFFFNILANHIDQKQVDQYWFLTFIADTIKNFLFCISIIVYVRSHHKEKISQKAVPYLDLDMN